MSIYRVIPTLRKPLDGGAEVQRNAPLGSCVLLCFNIRCCKMVQVVELDDSDRKQKWGDEIINKNQGLNR